MHCTGQTSTHARSFTSMHASVMIARPATSQLLMFVVDQLERLVEQRGVVCRPLDNLIDEPGILEGLRGVGCQAPAFSLQIARCAASTDSRTSGANRVSASAAALALSPCLLYTSDAADDLTRVD